MKQKINIIGSGVIGLTTAIVLLEKNYDVSITAEHSVHNTVSAKAAAVWFPFKVEPRAKAKQWSSESYEIFEKLAVLPHSGVSMVDFLILIKEEEDAWWKSAIPEKSLRKARTEELPTGYDLGYMMNVPLIETPIYLDYLLARFYKLGGDIVLKKIKDIEEVGEKNDFVINCTGLGAVDLVGDQQMYPIRGQIVKVDPIANIDGFAEDYASGEGLNELAYLIPRSDCMVLGGTTDIGQIDLEPNEETTQRIIEDCMELAVDLETVTVQSVVVGLRPGRSTVRLEKEEGRNIIHNYGHGGGGFTVSWGCADEVSTLIALTDL